MRSNIIATLLLGLILAGFFADAKSSESRRKLTTVDPRYTAIKIADTTRAANFLAGGGSTWKTKTSTLDAAKISEVAGKLSPDSFNADSASTGKRGNATATAALPVKGTTTSGVGTSAIGLDPNNPVWLPHTTGFANVFNTSAPTNSYPYRAIGKVSFTSTHDYGFQEWTCTATLLAPGIAVTSAWCVTDAGHGHIIAETATFVPAYFEGTAPYGTWTVEEIFVPDIFLDTDDEEAYENAIAVLVVKRTRRTSSSWGGGTKWSSRAATTTTTTTATTTTTTTTPYYTCPTSYPGELVGWLGVGYDAYSFQWSEAAPLPIAQVTTFGYSQTTYSKLMMANSMASLWDEFGIEMYTMTGMGNGAMGGPWIVNFNGFEGAPPVDFFETSPNVVVGVTAYSDDGTFEMWGTLFSFTYEFYDVPNVIAGIYSACAWIDLTYGTTEATRACSGLWYKDGESIEAGCGIGIMC